MKYWLVDSFTKTPFQGNPAGVLVFENDFQDDLKQNIAMEMNLSETSFIYLKEGNPEIRWFTAIKEIDLCGHATIAAAHTYLNDIRPDLNAVTFDTRFVGPITVTKDDDGYTLDFPSRPGKKIEVGDIPAFALDALTDIRPLEAYQSRDLMLVYESEKAIMDIKPDFKALLSYEDFIIVTAPSDDPQYDFVSRFFCADDAIAEDPVTGSAHCTSGPYWAKRLGKNVLKAYQASKRGGVLHLEITPDRVHITGPAVTILKGDVVI